MTINAKKEFLEKAILGRKVDFNDPDEVIDACVSNSCGDMMVGAKYFLPEGDKERIKNVTIELLNKHNFKYDRSLIIELAEEIFPNHSPSELIEFEKIQKGKREGQVKINKATGFGLAQKVINMSYKHFFTFNEYMKNKNIDYSKCECPLDKNVLEPKENPDIYNPINNPEHYKWTYITETQYDDIQKQITQILANDPKVISKLANYEDLNNVGNMKYDFVTVHTPNYVNLPKN